MATCEGVIDVTEVGVMSSSQSESQQWLNKHHLDKELSDKFKQNHVTLDLLAMCSEQELREIMRDDFGIKNILLLKRFIKAVQTLPNAKINDKSPQVLIFMGLEEKEIMELLYENYTQVCNTVTKIQNQFTYLQDKSATYNKHINDNINAQISHLEKQRKTLLQKSRQKLIEYKKQINDEFEKQQELQKYYLNAKQQFRDIAANSDLSSSNRLKQLKSLVNNDKIDLRVVNKIHQNIESDFNINIYLFADEEEKKVEKDKNQHSKLLKFTLEMSSKYGGLSNTAELLLNADRDQGCGTNSSANQYIQISFDGYKKVTKMYIAPLVKGWGVQYLTSASLQWKDSNNKWKSVFRYFQTKDADASALMFPKTYECVEEKKVVDVVEIPANTKKYLQSGASKWWPPFPGESFCLTLNLTTTAFRLYNAAGYCAVGSWQCYGFATNKPHVVKQAELVRIEPPDKQVVELNYTFSMSSQYGGLPNNRNVLMTTDPLQGCATNYGATQWISARLNGRKFVTHIRIGAPGNLGHQGWGYGYLNYCTLQYKADNGSWDDVWPDCKFKVSNTTIVQLTVNIQTSALRLFSPSNYVVVSHWKIFGCN